MLHDTLELSTYIYYLPTFTFFTAAVSHRPVLFHTRPNRHGESAVHDEGVTFCAKDNSSTSNSILAVVRGSWLRQGGIGVSLLQYRKNCRNIANIDIAASEYEDKKALIDRQFNDGVDLLRQDMASRMSSLRNQRDEQLVAAWINYITIITPCLTENDLSILMELGALPAPVDLPQQLNEDKGANRR
jgi:hypothetical protein